jgi:diaminopimelate epimerase
MYEFIDKTTGVSGTKINRKALMAMQGFIGQTTTFEDDGSIVERNSDGHTKTTIFNNDGSITEKFVGQKTITKITIFNTDGSITEVIS